MINGDSESGKDNTVNNRCRWSSVSFLNLEIACVQKKKKIFFNIF